MSDSTLDKSALAASDILERLQRQRTRKKDRVLRSCVAAFVTVAHVAVALWLVQTRLVQVHPEKPPPKTQLLWLLLPPAPHTPGNESQRKAEDMVKQAYKAVQLLPLVREDVERPNAITIDPGLALGRALACGAGKFEYLSRDGRAHCISKPWTYTFDQYGYIILDVSPQERKKKEEKPRPSDVQAYQRNTQPVCPKYIDPNAPCLELLTP